MHKSRPDEVVSCKTTDDVVAAVKRAREANQRVAVRAGGHSIAGLSAIDGGMLIDLAPMSTVEVDPERRLAKVGGGALWRTSTRRPRSTDSPRPAAWCPTPASRASRSAAATAGCGASTACPRDNVVEAEIVTADGEVLTASADENPDLYWAIRGGGGNFGIVTSFTFALHPVGPEVAFSATFYPIEEYAQVLRGWRDYVEQAPDEVTSVCVGDHVPGQPGDARGDPRPAGRDRRRRLRRRRGGGPEAHRAPARARHAAVRHVRARRRSSGSRPASTRCSRATRCGPTGSRSTWTS